MSENQAKQYREEILNLLRQKDLDTMGHYIIWRGCNSSALRMAEKAIARTDAYLGTDSKVALAIEKSISRHAAKVSDKLIKMTGRNIRFASRYASGHMDYAVYARAVSRICP